MYNTGYISQELASPQTVQHIYQSQAYETPNSQTQQEINQLMAALNIGSEDIVNVDDVQKRFDELVSAQYDDLEAGFSAEKAIVSLKPQESEGLQQQADYIERRGEEALSQLDDSDQYGFRLQNCLQTQVPRPGEVELFKDALRGLENADSSKDDLSGCNFEARALYPMPQAAGQVPEIVFDDDSAPEARSKHSNDEDSSDSGVAGQPLATLACRPASPVFYYYAVYRNKFISPSFSGVFKTTAQSYQSQTGAYLPDTQNILLQLYETQGLHDTAPCSNAFSSTQPARKAENVKIDNDNYMDITDITQNDVEVYSMTEYYYQAPTVLYQPSQADQFDHLLKSPEKEAAEPVNSEVNRVRLVFRWSGQSAAQSKFSLKLSVK